MSEHTPLPYRPNMDEVLIIGSNNHVVCETCGENYKEKIRFIIEACNNYAKLKSENRRFREELEKAAVRLKICQGRMNGCHEETGKHELMDEVNMFVDEAYQALNESE